MEWNVHCTQSNLTRVVSTVQPRLSYLLWLYGYYLGVSTQNDLSSYMNSTPCSIFYLGLTQSVFFALLLHCSKIVCSFSPLLFVESFVRHFDSTIVLYQQPPKLHFEKMIVPYRGIIHTYRDTNTNWVHCTIISLMLRHSAIYNNELLDITKPKSVRNKPGYKVRYICFHQSNVV